MTRKIATVYEGSFKCGHTWQQTVSIRPSKKELEKLRRVNAHNRKQLCYSCDMRQSRFRGND